jgi:hypothetical protein
VVRVFDLRYCCLPGVLSFGRAGNFDDLSSFLEGLSDVGLLVFPLLSEGLVVCFVALVVPRNVVLMVFVDTLGVGG